MGIVKRIERVFGLGLPEEEEERLIDLLLEHADRPPDTASILNEAVVPVNVPATAQAELFSDNSGQKMPSDLLSLEEARERYGYSTIDSIQYWITAHPDVVRPYQIDGEVRVSKADCDRYMATIANGPMGKSKIRRKKQNSGRELRAVSSPQTSAEPLLEFETITGASRRTNKSRDYIKGLIEDGYIQSLEIEGCILVSIREIEWDGKYPRPRADFAIFGPDGFLPMKRCLEHLGVEHPHNISSRISEVCSHGEIANRGFGRLRFCSVSDMADWLIENM